MKELIFLEPVFKETIWGGDRLGKDYGYDIPSDHTGECWAISAHENGTCKIANGEFKGMLLSELFKTHREVFGGIEGEQFPLLVKIIDARDDLSIQVHPDDEYAAAHENGSLGKTECWYIIDCDEDAQIVIGHNAKDSAQVKEMIEAGKWDEFIRVIPVHAGDFFQIYPGTVHAIKRGTMILETQQSSDITYRVYDYGRLQNGKPRQLHIQQSIDVIKAPFDPASAAGENETTSFVQAGVKRLVTCKYYSVYKITVSGRTDLPNHRPFVNMSVIEGSGLIDGTPIKKGDHFIIPSGYGDFILEGDMTIIASTV